MISFDTFTKFGKDGSEAAIKALTAMQSGAQAAAVESADFVKKSFEDGQQVAEKLLGAKTFETAVQIQGDYVRSAYEAFVAQTSKMGDLAVSTAKDVAAPFEGLVKPAA